MGKSIRDVGINGTPACVVGHNVVSGAGGAAALKAQVETARAGAAK